MTGIVLGFIAVCLVVVPDTGLPAATSTAWVLAAMVIPLLYSAENNIIAVFRPADLDALSLLCGMLIWPSDPCAAWTRRGRNKVMFGYSLNYLTDMENAVILDVEATPTRISKEVDATETMIERVEQRFALKPDHLAGDVAYGTGEMLGWLVGRDIDPHIPVWDQSKVAPDGRFTRADFVYDKARDLYSCPGGKELKTSGTAHDGTTIKYIAKRSDCAACPLKPRCTTGLERRVQRDVNQQARDDTQSLMETEAYATSSSERKKIERLFGEAKSILSMVRLRLRGLTGARDEFLLTATVQNLKRLANHTARPPPRPTLA